MLRIRAVRERQGLTQWEVARKAGISPSDVSGLENNRRILPGHLQRVCGVLGLQPERAFDEVRLVKVIEEVSIDGLSTPD